MNKGKSSVLLILLIIIGAVYILNPVRIIPALIKLRVKGLGIAALIALALVIAVIYFAFKPKKSDNKQQENQLERQLNTKGRQRVIQLRSLGMNIKNDHIRQQTEEICKSVEKILRLSENDIDKSMQANRFIEDYLITLGSVLTKYARLETNNNLTDEVTANAVECLEKIKAVSDSQQNSIVRNDIMDIAAEMETLLAMCKRDGLLAEEGFSFSTEEKITLVL